MPPPDTIGFPGAQAPEPAALDLPAARAPQPAALRESGVRPSHVPGGAAAGAESVEAWALEFIATRSLDRKLSPPPLPAPWEAPRPPRATGALQGPPSSSGGRGAVWRCRRSGTSRAHGPSYCTPSFITSFR